MRGRSYRSKVTRQFILRVTVFSISINFIAAFSSLNVFRVNFCTMGSNVHPSWYITVYNISGINICRDRHVEYGRTPRNLGIPLDREFIIDLWSAPELVLARAGWTPFLLTDAATFNDHGDIGRLMRSNPPLIISIKRQRTRIPI